MNKNAKIYVAGHRGLVGSSILTLLKDLGYTNLIYRTHDELDLTNQKGVNDFFSTERPDYVFLAAAKVGGIGANFSYPAEFIYKNMLIGFNVIHASYMSGVKKLLNLGSSCIYPKLAPQPLKEEYLLTGALEPTNDAYAIAKIAAIKLCQSYNRQYKTNYLSVMPTNLYGPGDNFNLETSHVLPAIMRKVHEAKKNGTDTVTLWGDGSPYREFLYSRDLADAVVFLMNNYNASDLGDFVNVGTGVDLQIKELAQKVIDVVYSDTKNRSCKIIWDNNKANGTPRKILDISKIRELGWKASVDLEVGLLQTYNHFLKSGGN